MKTVVAAPQDLWEELNTTLKNAECVRVSSPVEFDQYNSDDVFFNLFDGAEKLTYRDDNALIFINCVDNTLAENNQHRNVFRIASWNGFLRREKWEIAGAENHKLHDYIATIQKQMLLTPDVTGFISLKILSMIINEAYFTLEEGVSTKNEIDIAMKLGTNYPKGPFEWSREIGISRVYQLLVALSKEDARYRPAPLLIKESLTL